MARIIFRPQATADLADIYAYGMTQFGAETASHYHAGLQATVERLASFPQSGPIYPGLRPPVRYLAYRRHYIFYDYDGSTVWIVRVLHHAMDAIRLL